MMIAMRPVTFVVGALFVTGTAAMEVNPDPLNLFTKESYVPNNFSMSLILEHLGVESMEEKQALIEALAKGSNPWFAENVQNNAGHEDAHAAAETAFVQMRKELDDLLGREDLNDDDLNKVSRMIKTLPLSKLRGLLPWETLPGGMSRRSSLTLLHKAVQNVHIDAVRLLLERLEDADVRWHDNHWIQTPLHLAVPSDNTIISMKNTGRMRIRMEIAMLLLNRLRAEDLDTVCMGAWKTPYQRIAQFVEDAEWRTPYNGELVPEDVVEAWKPLMKPVKEKMDSMKAEQNQ